LYGLKGYLKIVLDNVPMFRYNTCMKKYKTKPWTDTERKTLAKYYYHACIEEVCSLLPDRSEQAIRNQVAYLRKRGYRFNK
jgi:hypothetical protein